MRVHGAPHNRDAGEPARKTEMQETQHAKYEAQQLFGFLAGANRGVPSTAAGWGLSAIRWVCQGKL